MKNVFLSIVTKSDWPGFAALVQSIQENSGLGAANCRFVVFADPDPGAERWVCTRGETIKIRPLTDLSPTARAAPDADLIELSLWNVCDEGERLVHLAPDLLCLSPLADLDEICPFAAAPADAKGMSADIHTSFMIFQPSSEVFHELLERHEAAPDHFQAGGAQDVINHWLALADKAPTVCLLSSLWNLPRRLLEQTSAESGMNQIRFLRFEGFKPWWSNARLESLADCSHMTTEKLWWPYFLRSRFPLDDTPGLGRINPFWRSHFASRTPRFWKQRMLKLLPTVCRPLVAFIRICRPCRHLLRGIWKFSSGILLAYRNQKRKHRPYHHSLPLSAPECIGKRVVLNGPFKGMKYPTLASHGSAIYPKILGTYERELEPVIRECIDMAPSRIVDIGCAEGYYAVGLALRLPGAQVIAADLSETALDLCRGMAALNGVSDRVRVIKGLSPRDLERFGNEDGGGLLICDCEGGERELLNEKVLTALSSWHLLVELHEFVHPGIEQHLMELAAKSHTIEIIDSIDDIRRVAAFPVPELADHEFELKMELYREGRPHPMKWLIARPTR